RIPPRPVSPSFLHVMRPGRRDALRQGTVDLAHNPTRQSHHQRAGRYLHALGDHRARGYDASRTDSDAVEQHAPHGDETIVSYRASVENHPVADSYPLANDTGNAVVHVDDGPILDVRLGPDDDGGHVTPQHRPIP